jgi:hypothetical protein
MQGYTTRAVTGFEKPVIFRGKRTAHEVQSPDAGFQLTLLTGNTHMSNIAKNVKSGIDSAAKAAKNATDKTVAAGQKAATKAGDAMKSAGDKIKKAAK